jgi:hypothetical protein
VRDPVNLVDARAGVEGGAWGVYAFGSNLFDEEYNAEFSPGGFVFKARPRIYGWRRASSSEGWPSTEKPVGPERSPRDRFEP